MQMWNEPYYTQRLQKLHISGLVLNLVYVVLKLVSASLSAYSGQIASSTKKAVDDDLLIFSRAFNYVDQNSAAIEVLCYVMFALLGLAAFQLLRAYYIHFLVSLIERGYFNMFRIFSCFCRKLRPFMQANMNRNVFYTRWKVIPRELAAHLEEEDRKNLMLNGEKSHRYELADQLPTEP